MQKTFPLTVVYQSYTKYIMFPFALADVSRVPYKMVSFHISNGIMHKRLICDVLLAMLKMFASISVKNRKV